MSTIPVKWSKGQHKFYNRLRSPFRIMPTGRRYGKTLGAAQHCVLKALRTPNNNALWCDCQYRNIGRYIDRMFIPLLKFLPSEIWSYNKVDKIIKVNGSIIDFGSADRSETLEGFGYRDIYVNEAGIILKGEKGRYLWNNALLPMLTDFEDATAYIFGTPKGMVDPDGNNSLYYDMWLRCLDDENPDYSGITQATSDNPFLSKTAITRVKNELPSGAVRDQEFYGKFVQCSAGIIRGEWFRYRERPEEHDRRVRAWDLAFSIKTSADYYAGALCSMGEFNDFTVEHMSRGKKTYPDFRQHLIETAWQDGKDVPIILEKAGQQGGFIDDLRSRDELRGFMIYEQKPERDKFTRAMPWVAAAEGGKVFLVRGQWNQPFITEAESFTGDDSHAHDDQIDSISMAYRELCKGDVEMVDNPFM